MYNCGHRINLYLQGKADSLDVLEGSRPECVKASIQCHHRGLRAGHVFTGVAWELERANCLLVNESGQGPPVS